MTLRFFASTFSEMPGLTRVIGMDIESHSDVETEAPILYRVWQPAWEEALVLTIERTQFLTSPLNTFYLQETYSDHLKAEHRQALRVWRRTGV